MSVLLHGLVQFLLSLHPHCKLTLASSQPHTAGKHNCADMYEQSVCQFSLVLCFLTAPPPAMGEATPGASVQKSATLAASKQDVYAGDCHMTIPSHTNSILPLIFLNNLPLPPDLCACTCILMNVCLLFFPRATVVHTGVCRSGSSVQVQR